MNLIFLFGLQFNFLFRTKGVRIRLKESDLDPHHCGNYRQRYLCNWKCTLNDLENKEVNVFVFISRPGDLGKRLEKLVPPPQVPESWNSFHMFKIMIANLNF